MLLVDNRFFPAFEERDVVKYASEDSYGFYGERPLKDVCAGYSVSGLTIYRFLYRTSARMTVRSQSYVLKRCLLPVANVDQARL